jgi:hypothetical protein
MDARLILDLSSGSRGDWLRVRGLGDGLVGAVVGRRCVAGSPMVPGGRRGRCGPVGRRAFQPVSMRSVQGQSLVVADGGVTRSDPVPAWASLTGPGVEAGQNITVFHNVDCGYALEVANTSVIPVILSSRAHRGCGVSSRVPPKVVTS